MDEGDYIPELEVPNELPRYSGYYERPYLGGYATVTQCQQCKNVGLYEDCHVVNPCKHCGGRVYEAGSRKWIPPQYKGIFFRKLIQKGYWKRN